MLRVPDYKIREIFLLLGASEEALDRLVETYQTRHVVPLALELRVEYFNFLGIEDTWERISHTIRGDNVQAIIDFWSAQSPGSLVYKRCMEKLCHFIFAPAWTQKLGEMWSQHSLHSHDPRTAWAEALDYAKQKDSSGLLAENLVSQVFKMKDASAPILEVRQQFAGKPKFQGPGVWRPLKLQERHALSEPPQEALEGWLADQELAREEILRSTELNEFRDFITTMKNAAKSPADIPVLIECIERYEQEKNHPLPETKARVRRIFFEKLIEPYRNLQYQ